MGLPLKTCRMYLIIFTAPMGRALDWGKAPVSVLPSSGQSYNCMVEASQSRANRIVGTAVTLTFPVNHREIPIGCNKGADHGSHLWR